MFERVSLKEDIAYFVVDGSDVILAILSEEIETMIFLAQECRTVP